MTEAEWLACPNPDLILTSKHVEKLSLRKLGLCGIACLLRLRLCQEFDDWRNAIEVSEAKLDKAESIPQLQPYHRNWSPSLDGSESQHAVHLILYRGLLSIRSITTHEFIWKLRDGLKRIATALTFAEHGILPTELEASTPHNHPVNLTWQKVRTAQWTVLHDVFGNPFCRISYDSAWNTSTVLALATGIYEEKAFDRLPILADALQDAGCENDEILNHLRQQCDHVRGCWALDLVLGKEKTR